MKKDIILVVNGDEFTFHVDGAAYRNYLDETTMSKKSVPADRLLLATVDPEDKPKLEPHLDAGFGLEIAAELVEAYSGGLRIVAKKSKTG